MQQIQLNSGVGLCPRCQAQGLKFRLFPVLLESTRGTGIPLYCKHCKTQYVVTITDPSAATVNIARRTASATARTAK